MYIQKSLWKDAVAQTFNQTDQQRLEKAGTLLNMLLIFSSSDVSGFGQGGGDWRLLDELTDVQLIGNGSRVIQALKAREHQYRGYLAAEKVAPDSWRNYATNTQWVAVPLVMGRRWLDYEYGLNLGAWDEVLLKVTNVATSALFSNNIAMTAIATYLRDAPGGASKGYMKAEGFSDYVPVAGSTQVHDLPTEGKLRQLILHLRPGVDANFIENTSFQNLADLIKLYLKSRSLPVWDDSAFRLAFENWYDYSGEVLTSGMAYVNNGKGFDVGIGRVMVDVGLAQSQTGVAATVIPTVDGDRQSFTQQQLGFQTDVMLGFLARGMGYHNMLTLPVAWGDDPTGWLDLAANKQVTLDVRTRSGATVTNAKNRVLIERPAQGVDQLV